MRRYPIDLMSHHPSFAHSARLLDINEGATIYTFDPRRDTLEAITFASGWRQEKAAGWLNREPALMATTTDGRVIDLRAYGIHHHEDGKWEEVYSILHARTPILNFYATIKEGWFADTIAVLEMECTGFINGIDDSFWRTVQRFLNQ